MLLAYLLFENLQIIVTIYNFIDVLMNNYNNNNNLIFLLNVLYYNNIPNFSLAPFICTNNIKNNRCVLRTVHDNIMMQYKCR